MATLPLPALPRWAVSLAVAVWIGLLIVTAWLNTFDDVWATVVAEVVGTVAAVAFAATGIAALLTVWQHQALFREVAGATAARLNQSASLVQDLVFELLEAQKAVVPSIAAAGPDDLALLLSPPLDREARQLLFQVRIGTSLVDKSASGIESDLHAHVVKSLAAIPPSDDLELERWTSAQIVAGVVSKYSVASEQVPHVAAHIRVHWSNAAPIVEQLASTVTDLGHLPIKGARSVVVGAETLCAKYNDTVVSGPRILEAARSDDFSTRDVERALHEVTWLLAEVVTLSEHLTEARADFLDKVKEATVDDGPRYDARFEMESREQLISIRRLSPRAQVPLRVLAVWEELESGPAPGGR